MLSGPALLVSLRRLAFSILPIVLLIPASLQARAQATAPAVSFGSVNVGTPVSATVTFTFSASTTISSVSVVTQGATGLDFQAGTQAVGACAAGVHAANSTCNVVVNFTPLAAGLRSGAALLVNGSGNTVGVGYVSGSGSGATFETDSTAATQLISNDYPSQIIPDAAGNLYVGQFQTSSAVKLTPAGVQTSIAGASKNPYSIAVDGAGYIYIFDGLSDILYRTDPASGTQTTFMSGLAYGFGLATDLLGNVYVGQGGSAASGTILKYSSSGTLLSTLNVPAAPSAIISDASGNLYYTVYMGGLYTIAAGGTTSVLVATPPHNDLSALAFDAAGNLYIANDGNVLYEMPAGTHTLNAIVTDASMSTFILGVGVDGAGNLLYGKNASLYKVDRTHPTASLSGTTVIGSSSTEKTVSYRNIGSAPSAISTITASANGKVGPSNTCSAATPVAINATCVASLQFAPVAQGSPQNATLNLSGPFTAPVFTLTGDVAGDPTQLGFTSGPPPTLISGSSPGTVTVAIQDNSGSTILGLTDSLTLTITGPASPPPMTVSAVNGVATFNLSATGLITVGTYTFTASDNTRSLTSAMTTESVLPKYFTVAPGSLNPIVTTPDTMTVTAYDNAGNQATAYTGYVALTSTDAAATLPAAFALSSGQGTASVTFLTIGGQTVTARDLVTGLITGTSSSIQVRAVPSYIVTTGIDDNGSALATNCSDQSVSGATHDASCSLRDAFAAVTALSNSGTGTYVPTINFATSLYGQTITMAAASTVNGNVALVGPGAGANAITLSGNNSVTFLSQAATGALTNISGLTFVSFKGAVPSVLDGSNTGTYTLTNDTFSNNAYTGNGTGGALGINGAITITGCTFTGNTSAGGAGAFVTTQTSLAISNSLFSNNTAALGGGAISIYGSGAMSIVNTAFLTNKASSGNGGAVFVNVTTAPLTITNDTFNNNTATISGGALYTGGPLTISGSSFSANQTGSTGVSYGGAIYNPNAAGNSITNTNFIGNKVVTTGTIAYGGALYAFRMNLTNVLFSGNSVSASSTADGGGAIYFGTSSSTFTGVTFTGNTTGGGASTQNGGAVYASTSQLTLYNTTITGNSAKTSGGYSRIAGSSNLYNSVISGNTATTFPDMNTAPSTYSSSYIDIGNPCSGSCTPLLSALGSYGGGTVGATGYTTPVMTMLPLPGSPLLAAGSLSYVGAPGTLSGGATTDARGTGYPRTTFHNSSNHVDIGAAEANYSLSFVQQPTTTQSGSTVTPAPTVQLLESGVAGGDGVGTDQGSYAGGTLSITATPDAASATTVTTTATGLESLNESLSGFTPSETLTVSAQSGATTPVTVASATSNPFGIGLSKTINFTQPASPAPAGSTATLVATASNSDPVTFSVIAGSGTASISGNIITFLTPGTVTVSADSAATSTTLAAPTVSYSVTSVGMPYVFVVGSGSAASLDVHGVVSSSAVAGGGNGAAIDASGYIWSINSNGTSLSTFTPTGTLGTSYSPTGITAASALAIDGNSNILVANGNGTVSTVSNAGLTLHTTNGTTTVAPSGVTIDNSGNIWVTNPTTNTLDEIIGGAAPAAPLANAVQNNTTGVKP